MSTDSSDPRARRSSVTQAALANLFQRHNSVPSGTPTFPNAITSAPINDPRRRLSVSTLGLSGTSPTTTGNIGAAFRRASMSTNNSDSIDESAIEEDDSPNPPSARTAPTTPFARRMSFGTQAMWNLRQPGAGGTSPGSNGRQTTARNAGNAGGAGSSVTTPTTAATAVACSQSPQQQQQQQQQQQARRTNRALSVSDVSFPLLKKDQGFNWSEQLRSRAESITASGGAPRGPAAAGSPPRSGAGWASAFMGGPASGSQQQHQNGHHDRHKSVSDMPAPPSNSSSAAARPPPRPQPTKPDAFQERILKGDFYMD